MATRGRVLLDTNILLDVFDEARVGHDDALALLWYATLDPCAEELCASVTSYKDAYYILCRLYKNESLAREKITYLYENAITPLDMRAGYGRVALESDEPDFEDGLLRALAEAEGMDAIVTRDSTAYANCSITHMDAGTFLSARGFNYDIIDF